MNLTILGTLPGLNEYTAANRGNKFLANKFKQDVELNICLQLHNQIRFNIIPKPPVKIKFTWFEKDMRRDIDNIIFAKKFILDALQKLKVIDNDNRKNIIAIEDVVPIIPVKPKSKSLLVNYLREQPRIEIEIIEL